MRKTLSLLVLLAFPSCAHALVPQAKVSAALQNQIEEIAGHSACAKFKWAGRGRAPLGYSQGMAISFANALCQANPLLAGAEGNPKKDALAHYHDRLTAMGFRLDQPGHESLRALYLLGFGEGMRESTGKYCEGWDQSAGANRPSETGEAGLFQTSFDSLELSNDLISLYNHYRNHSNQCLLEEFRPGVICRAQGLLGTGAGAEYQAFTKTCPAFSTDSAMVLMRIQRQHFGPINRREVELSESCERLLSEVQALVESNRTVACEAL